MAKDEIASVEMNMNVSPKKRTLLGPSLSESLPARGERTATATAPGARIRPAAAGVRPLEPSSSSGARKRLPMLVNCARKPTKAAARNEPIAKIRGEMKGSGVVRMCHANDAPASPARSKHPHTRKEESPIVSAWV